MAENHLLGFDSLDAVHRLENGKATLTIADQFQQDDAIGGRER